MHLLLFITSVQRELCQISSSVTSECCFFFPSWFYQGDTTIEGKVSSPKLWVFSRPDMTKYKYLRAIEQVRKKIVKTSRFRSEVGICAENRMERKERSIYRERRLVVFFTQFKGIFCRHCLCCISFLSHYSQLCLSNIC